MRPTLLLLAIAALLPATADAQRRYRSSHDDGRGTDLQVIAQGNLLVPNGVGLRFWMTPRTALATRFEFEYVDFDRADASLLNLSVGLNVERHMDGGGRVHPYFTLGGSVNVLTLDNSNFGDGSQTRTVFGGEAGLGAEADLFSGLSLSAQYTLGVHAGTGDDFGNEGNPEGPGFFGGVPDVQVKLGGAPRIALSFRF